MTTQFIVSLLGIIVAGLVLFLVVGRFLLRKHKSKPVSMPANIAICVIICTAGLFSGYKFLEASFDLAMQAADKAAQVGQKLITATVNFGTVSVLEGFGKSAEHFNEKWRQKTLSRVKSLEFSVVSCTDTKSGEDSVMHLVLGIKNTCDRSVDFNHIVDQQHILMKDAKGMCYPLDSVKYENSTLPAGVTSVRKIDITLPKGIAPTVLITPSQEVPLRKD
jgi:hypothetical protein